MIFTFKNFLRFTGAEAVLMMISFSAHAQPSITGPTCALPGFVYDYRISGAWDSTSSMQLCVTGGTIKSNDTSLRNCTPNRGAPLGSVLIVWTNPGVGILSLGSTIGNNSLNVNITLPFKPGLIDSASKYQKIGYDSIPPIIVCSNDSGGICAPIYLDQWQQSTDRVSWTDIAGATTKNFQPNSLEISTFYRRKVTETNSGTIGYSDIAEVDVSFKIR